MTRKIMLEAYVGNAKKGRPLGRNKKSRSNETKGAKKRGRLKEAKHLGTISSRATLLRKKHSLGPLYLYSLIHFFQARLTHKFQKFLCSQLMTLLFYFYIELFLPNAF